MGLLDAFRQYLGDAAPGGLLNPEWTPERVREAGNVAQSFIPVWGGIKGARDEWAAGNPGWAAFNAATVPLDLASLGGATALKVGLLGAIKPGGMQAARKAIEAALGGQRVKPQSIAELTQAQFDGINALRAQNSMPPLPSREVDYLGRHHAVSRDADGYATQDMLKQLMSGLDDSARPAMDRFGRVGLESVVKRHDGYGNAVNDLATFNVDGNRTVAEVLSVIPKGDKGRRPIDQIKKAGEPPPEFLSHPVSDGSRRMGADQPLSSLVTEQDVRNWIAQDNAVKMLGLQKNNTAMERARAMGFDAPMFHETSGANVERMTSFDPRRAKAAASDEQTPYAVFLKPDPHGIGLGGDNVAQMPLMARLGKQNTYRDRAGLEDHLMFDPASGQALSNAKAYDRSMLKKFEEIEKADDANYGRRGYNPEVANKFLDEWEAGNAAKAAVSKQAITDFFNKEGIDSVRLMRDDGSFKRAVDTTMILNPANIRSRFAAFDPARRHEADLLGHADPRLLGLMAGGGLLGLGAYGLLGQTP